MKSILDLNKKDIQKIKLIVFDVDGVLVHRGTIINQYKNRTEFETKTIGKNEIENIKQLHKAGYRINISSGRSLFMLMDMFREVLDYVYITYENGIGTWLYGEILQHNNSYNYLKELRSKLNKINHKYIKGFEPKTDIITIHCTDRVKEIETAVDEYKDTYYIWNGEAYDVGVKGQNKAIGLDKLMNHLKLKKENVLVIADNLNDIELINSAGVKVTCDSKNVGGDFFVSLPAGILMEKILEVTK